MVKRILTVQFQCEFPGCGTKYSKKSLAQACEDQGLEEAIPDGLVLVRHPKRTAVKVIRTSETVRGHYRTYRVLSFNTASCGNLELRRVDLEPSDELFRKVYADIYRASNELYLEQIRQALRRLRPEIREQHELNADLIRGLHNFIPASLKAKYQIQDV